MRTEEKADMNVGFTLHQRKFIVGVVLVGFVPILLKKSVAEVC